MELENTEQPDAQLRFLGIRGDVSGVLKAADFVVQSSHIDGFCLAAVEGMAAGKPVIVSDIPGLKDVVGDAGVLFPHADPVSLAQEIAHLAHDEQYCHEVASRCSERAKHFGLDKMLQGYMSVYTTLCPQPQQATPN